MIVWDLKTVKDRCKEDGLCWIWQQATNNKGAPQATINGNGGQLVRRHVYAVLMGKELRRGFVVSAKCGRFSCVSPDCLYQRSRGKVLEEVYASGARSDHKTYVRQALKFKEMYPERVPLDFDRAREIRARKGEKASDLAKEYGVGPDAIRSIWRNEAWKEPATSVNASVFSWAQAA